MTLQKKFEQAARATDRYTDIIVKDRLYAAYKESLDVVRSQTATLYEKHAKDGILTMGEVSKYNRLANLEKDIAAEMTRLGGKQVRATTQVIKGVYQESAYRTAYALNTEMPDIALNFGLLPTKQVEQAILNPMDRIGWPNRTREQIAIANRQVREVITQGIIQGKPYPDMARDIKEKFDMAAYKAERIVRTEAHRARSMGQLATLEEAHKQGVEMVKVWVSAMDDRVRDSHGALDGQKVPMVDEEGNPGMFISGAGNKAEAPGMFNVASEDVNCRCSMRGEVPGYEPTERRERLTEEEYNQRVAAEAERAAKENRDPLPIARSEVKPYRTYPEYAKEKGFPSLYKGAEPRVVGAVVQAFTPAKTIAEAEAYAQQFSRGKVSYRGMDVDAANEVNKALLENGVGTKVPKYKSIIAKFDKGDALAGTHLMRNDLVLNTRTMGSPKKLAAYQQQAAEADLYVRKNVHLLDGAAREKAERLLRHSRSLIDTSYRGIITHETGHHIDHLILMQDKPLRSAVVAGREQYIEKLSSYAEYDAFEYMAESYTAYRVGEVRNVAPELVKLFRRLGL